MLCFTLLICKGRGILENIINLKDIEVVFEDGERILKKINLDIKDKEFVTFLGPSGCGKTTTLRIIGGFLEPTSGDVFFEGKRINGLPPYKRNVNTVFQRYALFPHLNVYENIAFGLKVKKLPDKEIVRRVGEMLELVNLKGFEKRSVSRLSGGQQQRVAIARALVNHPKVLLLDEPLGALDLKLRKEMQVELRKIQQALELTFIYVTHDQEEAMSISDTIAVMNAGKIQHIGTPRDIYQRPANTFVATFIGRTNILDARMEQGALVFPNGERFTRDSWAQIPDGPVKVSVRPEEFVVHHADEKVEGISAVLEDSVYLGLNTHYYLKLSSGASVELIQESTIEEKLEPGSTVTLTLKNEKINIFSEDGAKNYLRG